MLQFKYGMIYRDVIPFRNEDLCAQIANPKIAHPLVKQVMTLMKVENPKSVHDCPYSV